MVGLKSAQRGLRQVGVDENLLAAELDDAWEVLAEAVQTVMRKQGGEDAYELLKGFTRGQRVTEADMREFVKGLELPSGDKERLMALTPAGYTGIAAALVARMDGRDEAN